VRRSWRFDRTDKTKDMSLKTTKLLFTLSCLFVVTESILALSGIVPLHSWWHRVASLIGGLGILYFTIRMLQQEKQAKQHQ
jgi:threonine/homoserine/homoserine lactone efflux protein